MLAIVDMHSGAIAVTLLLACAWSASQEIVRESDLPAETEVLLVAARAAPPEFHADALIRIARSKLVAHPATRIILLEEAFAVAANAQEPVKRESAIATADTRASVLSRGFDMELDAMSLQSRAAETVLGIDAELARDQFARLRPVLPPLACSDPLIYQLSEFYLRASRIVVHGANERHAQPAAAPLLEILVTDLGSPAQVAGVADLLQHASLPESELERLALLFAWELEVLSGDSRSFFQATGAPAGVGRLIHYLKSRGLAPDRVIEALRAYLVHHLAADRCQTSGPNGRYWAQQVEDFNESIRTLGTSEIAAITPGEVQAGRVEGEPDSLRYWQTPEARALRDRTLLARRATSASDAVRGDVSVRPLEVLDAINAWSGRSDEREDYFHQKAILYSLLLRMTSDRNFRLRALADYAGFLASYDMERESRVAWAAHLEDLIRAVRESPSTERAAALALVEGMGNAPMKLRALLETAVPDEGEGR
jgi:hypothetical protein